MGLDSVEIVLARENTFGIEFPDRIARQARLVRDLEDMVIALRKVQLAPEVREAVEESEVRSLVRGIVANELGVAEQLVAPEAHLVRDLGMDA